MKIEIDAQGYWTAPDGSKWRVVPMEMTHDMHLAFMNQPSFDLEICVTGMLQAAPHPPAPASRYDWSKIPEGYDWAATDEDGQIFAYSHEPYPKGDLWFANGGTLGLINHRTNSCPDWRESLERRP